MLRSYRLSLLTSSRCVLLSQTSKATMHGQRAQGRSRFRGAAHRGSFGISPLESEMKQLSVTSSTNCPPLPPDIVYLIPRHAEPVNDGPYELTYEGRERLAFLRCASLVNSVWRQEAHTLLWEHVMLCSNKQIEKFLPSFDKDRHTTTLRLGAEHPSQLSLLDGNLAQKVLAGCRGVKSLELQCIVTLSPASFSAPSLESESKFALRRRQG